MIGISQHGLRLPLIRITDNLSMILHVAVDLGILWLG